MISDKNIIEELEELGVEQGDVLLVHSSYKALGRPSLAPETIIHSILEGIGKSGTLLMPALSYQQIPHNVHDSRSTPSNVGIIPERFRLAFDATRSLHPTHSVCAIGRMADELLAHHELDRTPCGVHSPFRKLLFMDAKILMLGCGCQPNTTMHAIEEIIGTPYLFGNEREYTIIDSCGKTSRAVYRDHGFDGFVQRYDRIIDLLPHDGYRYGRVGDAKAFLLNTSQLYTAGIAAMKEDRLHFVDRAMPNQAIRADAFGAAEL